MTHSGSRRRSPTAIHSASPSHAAPSAALELPGKQSVSANHSTQEASFEAHTKEHNELAQLQKNNETSPVKKGQHPLSPSKRSSPRQQSPRHGEILIMNPCPDYPKKKEAREDKDEIECCGEEFGMTQE